MSLHYVLEFTLFPDCLAFSLYLQEKHRFSWRDAVRQRLCLRCGHVRLLMRSYCELCCQFSVVSSQISKVTSEHFVIILHVSFGIPSRVFRVLLIEHQRINPVAPRTESPGHVQLNFSESASCLAVYSGIMPASGNRTKIVRQNLDPSRCENPYSY